MVMAKGVISGETGIGSHVPFLASAVARTTGPVLELGMGFWSTPLLHYLCRGRKLLSVDKERDWANRFYSYESDEHAIEVVDTVGKSEWQIADSYYWIAKLRSSEPWSVIFVDCSPGEIRGELVVKLRGLAAYIVAHDTEADIPPSGGNYGWAKVDGVYRYAVTDKSIRPWTTIYSDDEEFQL